MCQAKLFVDSLEDTLNGAQQLYATYNQQMSSVDHEINALYHEIEVGRYNTVSGYKALKRLQEKLRERRVIKHEYAALRSLVQVLNNAKLDTHLKRAKKTIESTDKSFAQYATWVEAVEA